MKHFQCAIKKIVHKERLFSSVDQNSLIYCFPSLILNQYWCCSTYSLLRLKRWWKTAIFIFLCFCCLMIILPGQEYVPILLLTLYLWKFYSSTLRQMDWNLGLYYFLCASFHEGIAEEKTPVNKTELQSSRKRGKFPEFIFTSGKYNPITVNLSPFIYGKCSYMLFSMSGTESASWCAHCSI